MVLKKIKSLLLKAWQTKDEKRAEDTQNKWPPSYYARIENIGEGAQNGKPVHNLLLTVDGVDAMIPAMILPIPSIQQESNIATSELKKGNIIKTCSIHCDLSNYVPVIVLGPVELCPPDTNPKNETPVAIGFSGTSVQGTPHYQP